ncbi:conserved hypothetical protein [Bradyrhizobium sp. ORS 375]|nr:conserved hypothetical protein [Bradyrhizobium sp. ORS 375]
MAAPRSEASRPCIGVIAAADRFMVRKIGFTAFDSETFVAPVESWGLDDLIAARVRAAAGAGVTVLRLSYPKGAFDPFYDPPSRPAPPPGRQLTEIVRRIAGSTKCRRYVVITASHAAYSSTNTTPISGVGVYQASLTKKTYLYAHLFVTVFDGDSFAIRPNPYATFQSRLERVFVPAKDFDREIDRTLFPASAAEAANSTALRNGARSVVTESLDDFLPAFFRE